MIKIIEMKEIKPNKKYKIECSCGCVFTFQDEDKNINKYIMCPCCKEELNLDVWHYEEV